MIPSKLKKDVYTTRVFAFAPDLPLKLINSIQIEKEKHTYLYLFFLIKLNEMSLLLANRLGRRQSEKERNQNI